VGMRPILGNFESPWKERNGPNRPPGKRRLVEECEAIWIYAVQRAFGKKALIAAIRQNRPFRLPVHGGYFDILLVDETHQLPGKCERWSSLEAGTARLWFVCAGCGRKVAKLWYYFAPGSCTRSDLLCRQCHCLTYLSTNCGGNRWYREIARPMKRVLREKQKLMARKQSPRVAARLALIDNLMCKLREKVKPRTQRRPQNLCQGLAVRERRVYRNLALVDPGAANMESICSAAEPERSTTFTPLKLPAPRKEPHEPSISPPEKTTGKVLEEYGERMLEGCRRLALDALSRLRARGLLTDERLRRSPGLRRAIAEFEREEGTPKG